VQLIRRNIQIIDIYFLKVYGNMINSETSLRLHLLRFPLIVGVVFIHMYSTSVSFNSGATSIGLNNDSFISLFIRNLISQEIAGVAVPIFFLISSYLFFNSFDGSRANYLKKIKTRFHTLLIPFLFWNIATLLIIALGQHLPFTHTYFSGKNPFIADFDYFDYPRYVFGVGVNPISYQFWFIRDLMLVCLLSPIILILNKKMPLILNSFLLYCWFFNQWFIFSPNIYAVLFFSLGCFIAINKKNLFIGDAYGKYLVPVYLVITLLNSLSYVELIGLHKLGILFGIVSTLYLTKFFIYSNIKLLLLSLGNTSFFVFAAHEPLLSMVRKITYKLLEPESAFLTLELYFLIPIIAILMLILLYFFLKSSFPQFLKIITGDRTSTS